MLRAIAVVISLPFFSVAMCQQVEKISYYDKKDSLIKEILSLENSTQTLQGPYKKYHQNGRLAVDGQYQNNLPVGQWAFYFEAGALKSKGQYADGVATGRWTNFYENGNLKSEGTYEQAKPDGMWNYYYENGNPKLTAEYKSGKETGSWTYFFETGLTKAVTNYSNDSTGKHTVYYYTGEVLAEGQKINNVSEGKWIYYFEDGSVKSTGRYASGKREGYWISYYPRGQVQSEGHYENGQKSGAWSYFHENGELQSSGEMVDDRQDGDWKVFSEKGQIVSNAEFTMGTGPITTYHTNGQIASQGFIKEGLRDSTWVYFNATGDKIGTASYKVDKGFYTGIYPNETVRLKGELIGEKKVGEWVIYDPEGNQSGTYHPYYKQRQIDTPIEKNPEILEDKPTFFDATKSDYGYQSKVNRYFDEVVNEFDAWILSSNPFFMLIDRLPVSVEYYHQERLGYELIYEHIRSPFTLDQNTIDIEDIYHQGHALSFRQKFYSRANQAGMFYFGHQVRGASFQFRVKTQESSGFRNILISTASENTFTYGWMIGWKFMPDAGDTGFSLDAFTGINVGLRSWQLKDIKDERANELFTSIDEEPFIFPFSFGLNIGWAFEKKKRKKRR